MAATSYTRDITFDNGDTNGQATRTAIENELLAGNVSPSHPALTLDVHFYGVSVERIGSTNTGHFTVDYEDTAVGGLSAAQIDGACKYPLDKRPAA